MAAKQTGKTKAPVKKRESKGPPRSEVELGAGSDPGVPTPTQEEIARLAYFRWIDRGGAHGRDVEDWIETERSLGEPEGCAKG